MFYHEIRKPDVLPALILLLIPSDVYG